MDSTVPKEGIHPNTLTASQRERIKRNRDRALQLRKTRIANLSDAENAVHSKATVLAPKDSGAGFFVEEDEQNQSIDNRPIFSQPPPLFAGERPVCLECNKEFVDSYLQKHFDYLVCDNCRDNDGEHCLISRTDAKKEYMLKDCDFDKREPALKFILKKNPHNLHGNMKLYLRQQVEKRALEVHGSEEKIEELMEQREENTVKKKKKAFDKKIKALRMEVRSSLYRKTDNTHVHVYGTEVYNQEEDIYSKTCSLCGHKVEFEKM